MIKRALKAQFTGANIITLSVVEGEKVYVVEVNYRPKTTKNATSSSLEDTTDGK